MALELELMIESDEISSRLSIFGLKLTNIKHHCEYVIKITIVSRSDIQLLTLDISKYYVVINLCAKIRPALREREIEEIKYDKKMNGLRRKLHKSKLERKKKVVVIFSFASKILVVCLYQGKIVNFIKLDALKQVSGGAKSDATAPVKLKGYLIKSYHNDAQMVVARRHH